MSVLRRSSAVTTALATGLVSALALLPATTPAQAADAPTTPAANGVPSKATVGGVTIENSFVSAQGWVHPDAGTAEEDGKYPSRILLTNGNNADTPASVTVSEPTGTTLLGASGPGTHPVAGDGVTWDVTVPAGKTVALVLEHQADTLDETPTLVWRDISSTAVLTVGGSTSEDAMSHGPKVIPPGATYETAKYGDRPFPVVPVAYTDRAYQQHEKDLNTVINSPTFAGSTFNLYQEMSLGQLYPDGTVPSDGITSKDFTYAPGFDFTKREVPGNTCTGGVTFADSPVDVEGTQVYPDRIKDGVYQLPGNTAFYGADANGSAIIGSLAGVGALQQIDAGCGSPGKLVRDAAAIADPEIDYSDYDTDKDGVVDFFMAVFAGCGGNGASQLGACADGTSNVAPYDNVWPHSSSLEYYYSDPTTGLPGFTTDDQLKDLEGRPLWYTDTTRTDMTTTDKGDALKVFVRIGPYNVNPETAIDKASVISHEYGHSLGLPDFYSTGSRETYGDWNLMATDKSQNMDVFSRQELGWVVPNVLEPGTSPEVDGWTDSKQDTDEISWETPSGTPYTLTEGSDGRVQNSEAYVAKLPGRQLLDPAKFDSGDKASKTHAWWSQSGNDFGCAPASGHNLDVSVPGLADLPKGTTVTLSMKSLWDTEWDFDYGYVLTTTDGGETYTSHKSENGYTTSNTDPLAGNPNANSCQQQYDNGLTGSSGSYAAGSEATDRKLGNYPDSVFLADSYDISDLAGEPKGALRFSYSTDPGVARPGWFIDDLKVTATLPSGDQVLLDTDLESTGGPDDERIFNGGCREDLTTAQKCTPGWAYVAAGAESASDHAYYLEMRDRSGFDLDGQGQIDRDPIGFAPGLSMVYTDEAHGYGNAGVDDPPAQTPLDSQPEPGSETPDLDDAAWTAAAGDSSYSDSGAGHTDNYTDPGNPKSGNPWEFLFDCLSFDVTSMSGNTDGPATSDGDLTGDVKFTMGDGCGTFDYRTGNGSGTPANTAPTADATASRTEASAGQQVQLDGSGSTDAETPDDLDYSWDFGNGGSTKDSSTVDPKASWDKAGEKTVTLTVTDPEGEVSTDTVTVTVTNSLKHVNAQNERVARNGSWRVREGADAEDGNYMDNLGSGQGTDRMIFSFTGNRVDLIYGTARRGGTAKVWIDGVRRNDLSFHADRRAVRIDKSRRYGNLDDGTHRIKLVVTKDAAYVEGFTYYY